MDIKDIRKIIEMMKQNDLSEFELEDEGFRIAIRRRNGMESQVIANPATVAPAASTVAAPPAAVVASSPANPGAAGTPEEAEESDANRRRITSPMVGTFYRSPSPDVDPFVSVGSQVDEDTVVCIIEAMKVMNEIKAEVRGFVRKILVENASPVQFGQPLFLVDPS